MGRQRQLTEALSAQRVAGRREGRTEARNATYERILKTVVVGVIAKELSDTVSLVLSAGPVAALTALESLAVVEWPARWIDATGPILASIAADVTQERRAKLIEANPAVGERFAVISEPSPEQLENIGKAAQTSKDKIAAILDEYRTSSVQVAAKALRDAEPDLTVQRSTFIAKEVLLDTAREAHYEQALRSSVIAGSYWRDSDDIRVRPEHVKLDGSYAVLGEPFPNGDRIVGKSDFACRCSQEFVLKPEFLGGRVG